MTNLEFALSIETSLLQEMKELLNDQNEIKPLIDIIYKTQTDFLYLINTAMHISVDTESFPNVSAAILGEDKIWKLLTSNYANIPKKSTEELICFWKLYTLTEKSAQFYQQAALNTPYLTMKLFFTSCAETKHMLKRRIHGILQIIYNHIWSEIGFSPIVFGKD